MRRAAFLLQNLTPAIPIRAIQRMQHRHLRPGIAGCAHECEGMLMVSKSHEWSSLSWRNLLWRADSCCFVAATHGLLGTDEAQILDIRREELKYTVGSLVSGLSGHAVSDVSRRAHHLDVPASAILPPSLMKVCVRSSTLTGNGPRSVRTLSRVCNRNLRESSFPNLTLGL
jgi:hypothetical protein